MVVFHTLCSWHRVVDPHPQVSIYAGMIVYLYGDKEQGLKTIEQGLLNGNSSTVSPYAATDAVSVLLESKGDKEFQISRQVFGRDYFTKGFSTDVQQLLDVYKKYRPKELNLILIDQLNDCYEFSDTWDANGNKIRRCDQWARFLAEGTIKPAGFSFNQLAPSDEKDKTIGQLKEYFREASSVSKEK